MNIIVAGGTGFIGRQLVASFLEAKHQVTVLSRDHHTVKQAFGTTVKSLTWRELSSHPTNGVDVVINLTGKSIGDGRWSDKVKKEIIESRVNATRQLTFWCSSASGKIPHLYNASAIGIYGLQPLTDTMPPALTETTPIDAPHDFLSEVGIAWESAADAASRVGMPVTFMRFGVVLKKNEGVLKKLQLSFKLGLGSINGTGTQPFSWIDCDDLVRAVNLLLAHPAITGPVNLCAPTCVSQREFAENLAAVMHRPCFLKMPAWVLRLMFAQMADELLLKGQHVYPERLINQGFQFNYPTIQSALQHEYGGTVG